MYQRYPASSEPPATPVRPEPPSSVRTAVKFMYAGATLSAVGLIIGLASASAVKKAIEKAYPHYTAAHVHSLEVASIVTGAVVGLLSIGLWIWMARANAAGHNYARIVGTALFGLNTLALVAFFSRPNYSIGVIFNVLVWLAGLGAIVMLWRPESGPYFGQNRPL
jgi:hypothetical protein